MADQRIAAEVDLLTLKTRSVSGIVTLISRTFFIRLVALAGTTLLSIFLQRSDFGLFAGINNIVVILSYFSDLGLAASLVQKKSALTTADLQTSFTLQQGLVLAGCLVLLAASPWIFTSFNFPPAGHWLFYSLVIAFFLASLKTIPSVILERQVLFKNLAVVEVVENLVYWTTAVILAWQGYGLLSYAWAVLLRGLTGTALIYYLSPWPIGLSVSVPSLKALLSFGLPFQLNSFLAVAKDRFLELVVWRLIGNEGVGIISWARNYSEQPLRLVMDNVSKVTFPSFARLQDHPVELRRGIEKSLLLISASTFPFVAGLCLLAPQVINLVPGLAKWQPAMLPLLLISVNTAWAAVSTPLSNVLNALGRVKVNTLLMLMWLGLTWMLTPTLAGRFGYLGVAYAIAIIACFSIIPILIARHYTGFSLKKSVGPPLLATAAMSAVTWSLSRSLASSWPAIVANILISAVFYSGILLLLAGPQFVSDVKKYARLFFKKS